jgi:hypothetical protein
LCKKIPDFVQNYLLTFEVACGILLLSRGEGMKKQGVKPSVADRCRNPAVLEKKCKKPLDKPLKV